MHVRLPPDAARAHTRTQGAAERAPADPIFEYADMEGCVPGCPLAPCSCARWRLWDDYGAPLDRNLPFALQVRLSQPSLPPSPYVSSAARPGSVWAYDLCSAAHLGVGLEG